MIKSFLDTTAAAIKAIDSNHLIASGAQDETLYGSQDYAALHSGANIDIATLHEYEYDYENSNAIVTGHLAPVLRQLATVSKPLVIAETGVHAAASGCRTTLAGRASVIRQKLDAYIGTAGVSGAMAWGIVQIDPTTIEQCPLEGRVTDPMIPVVKAKQAALNG